MSGFYCWDVLNSEPAAAKKVEALTRSLAAVNYAERIWSEGDYPTEMEIAVRCDGEPDAIYRVEARQEVNFYASLKEGGAG